MSDMKTRCIADTTDEGAQEVPTPRTTATAHSAAKPSLLKPSIEVFEHAFTTLLAAYNLTNAQYSRVGKPVPSPSVADTG